LAQSTLDQDAICLSGSEILENLLRQSFNAAEARMNMKWR
jgi:hypothetical protein